MLVEGKVIEGIDLWRHAILRPGEQQHQGNPCRALAAALQSAEAFPGFRDTSAPDPLEKLTEQLTRNPQGLVDRIEDQLNQHGRDSLREHYERLEKMADKFETKGRLSDATAIRTRLKALPEPCAALALVIDQAEELFHGDRNETLVEAFITALTSLARSGRIFILITLRSDFYDRYQKSRLLELSGTEGQVDLLPPDEDEIGQIIRQPAAAAGLRYETNDAGKSLDEELRDQARANPDSLPLLSHVLDLLFEKQKKRNDGWLLWEDYDALDRFDGALSTHAEEVFTTYLNADEQKFFPRLLSGLVHLESGKGGEDLPLRKDARLRDLIHDAAGKEIPGATLLIDVFSGEHGRLLTVYSGEEPKEKFVTISHEVLLRHWDRISDWVKENDEFLRRRDRIETLHQHYLEAIVEDQDEGTHTATDCLLHNGLQLQEGLALLKTEQNALAADLRGYIAKSFAKEQKRKKRLNLIRACIFAGLSLLTIFAGVQWRQSSLQEVKTRSALVEVERQKADVEIKTREQKKLVKTAANADLGAYFRAREQAKIDPEKRAESLAYLQRALEYTPDDPALVGIALAAEFPPEGDAYYTAWARLFDDSVNLLSFSHDGSQIAAGSRGGSRGGLLRLFDSYSGSLLWRTDFDNPLTALSFAPNASRIAAGSHDNSLRVLDSTSGTLIWREDFDNSVTLAYSPDGTYLAAGSAAPSLQVLDAATGNLIWRKDFDSSVETLAYSPKGNYLATGSHDYSLRVFDPISGTLLWQEDFGRTVDTIVFSPDGTFLAAGSGDGSLRIFNAASGKLIWRQDFDPIVNTISFSPDGSFLAAGAEDYSLRVFDAASGTLIWREDFGHRVRTLAFSPDGTFLAAGSVDYSLRVFETDSGAQIWSYRFSDSVDVLAFSPAGSSLAVGLGDKSIRMFETSAVENVIWRVDVDYRLSNLNFSADGSVVAASDDDSLLVCDAASGNVRWKKNFAKSVNTLAFSPNGILLAAGSDDYSLRVFESISGELRWREDFENSVNTLAFSAIGGLLAAGSGDNSIRIFEAASGRLLWRKNFGQSVKILVFSSDGIHIAAGSEDKSLRVFEAATGKLIWREDLGQTAESLAFSSGGSILAVGSADTSYTAHTDENSLRVFDVPTGKTIWTKNFDEKVKGLAFSPDGALLASNSTSSSDDKTLRVFEVPSSNLAWDKKFRFYFSFLFSPNGDTIFVSSQDDALQLFNASSGNLVGQTDFSNYFESLAISPDGRWLAAGSYRERALKTLDLTRLNALLLGSIPSQSADLLPGNHIAKLLRLSSLSEFDNNGNLRALNADSIDRGYEQKNRGIDIKFLDRYLAWNSTPPVSRTIFPNSETLLRDYISSSFIAARDPNSIARAYHSAPWHPLAPVSIAFLPVKNDKRQRKEFLCTLTLTRLKEAEAELWGKEHLATDAAYAARWMSDLGYPELARKTARLSLDLFAEQLMAKELLESLPAEDPPTDR